MTRTKNIFKRLAGRYWLIFGFLFYFGTSVSSIIRSFEPMSLGSFLYMSIDWLAACTIYFFLGAIFGFIADLLLSKNRKAPMWLWLTVSLWMISSVSIAIVGKKELVSPILIIIFPLAYGLFFPGIAFTMLFPVWFVRSFYGKLVFDIALLWLFAAWLKLELKNKRVAKLLLILLFAVFFLGFAGCAKSLS